MNHISKNGLNLIKQYEGFRSAPYRDAGGIWTIGYGETAGISSKTKPWSEPFASQRLEIRIRDDYEPYIHKLNVPLNQNQFDALVSAIYNLGPGVLEKGHSLGDALRRKPLNIKVVQDAIKLYDKARVNGTPRALPGLTRRRREEADLFGKTIQSEEDLKRKRLTDELNALRDEVRTKFHGDWSKVPKRKARAESIKKWLNEHK